MHKFIDWIMSGPLSFNYDLDGDVALNYLIAKFSFNVMYFS